ncbi:hypothetical protein N7470_000688 [Penicillium chermesinum]|nr:hypothetical protein N7470_000688 [Penicillium chermesinum]
MSQPWDYIAKLVCIGDSGTGKSSLELDAPLGSAVAGETLEESSGLPSPPRKPQGSQQKKMKLSLWDTAGQETYKSITRSYFRGASGALLVFDISRRSTFTSCTQWLQDLRQIAEEGIVVILVGNKTDLAEQPSGSNQRQVTQQEAEEWCRSNDIVRYVETSAKSGNGVERAFLEVAERIYRNIEAGKYDLNDRRSGVKGFGASEGANAGVPRTVTLGMDDAMRNGNGWTGNCC